MNHSHYRGNLTFKTAPIKAVEESDICNSNRYILYLFDFQMVIVIKF